MAASTAFHQCSGACGVDGRDDGVPVAQQCPVAQRLQQHDAVREVAVDGTDRCAGALRDHGGGEPVEADLVDHFGGGVEQRVDPGGAALLDRLRAHERRSDGALSGDQVVDGHEGDSFFPVE